MRTLLAVVCAALLAACNAGRTPVLRGQTPVAPPPPPPPAAVPDDANFVLKLTEAVGTPEEDIPSYAGTLRACGYEDVNAIDNTPAFQRSLSEELAQLEVRRGRFLESFTLEDYVYLDRRWHHIDAKGLVLGRLATKAADLLRGKASPPTPISSTAAISSS